MDVRVARLERRAESDDTTLQSILLILERVDQRLAAHDREFATLKLDIGTLRSDVGTLKSDVGTLKSDMETLKGDVGALRQDLVAVKEDVETLTTVADVLSLKVATIESTTADTNRRVQVRGFSG